MKALFPMTYLNISQGYGVGTHKGSYAIDNVGKDKGIDNVYAPFDCKIKKIWLNGHTVWVESLAPVQWANGTVAKATMSFTHDNTVSNLRVGQVIKQGQVFYQEGTAGFATGNHVHIECAKGSFVGTGWFLNRFNFWTINNMVKPESLLFITSKTKVVNTGGYKWTKATVVAPKPPARKSNTTIAKEVIRGLWSTGPLRRLKLRRAGYNPDTIQAIVNRLMRGY